MITDNDGIRIAVRRSLVYNALFIVLGSLILIVLVNILREGLRTAAADAVYSDVEEAVVDPETHEVDFYALRGSGCRSTSWIYVPGTKINYPVVIGADNEFYLDHDVYGNESEAGAVFVNCANSADMSDSKTIIFGHNMADGSMFSNVHNYCDPEWGKSHSDMCIYLDDGSIRHYRLMCYLYTDPTYEPVYVIGAAEDIRATADRLLSDSQVRYADYGGGRLVCLSTCKYHEYRTVAVFEETPGQVESAVSVG